MNFRRLLFALPALTLLSQPVSAGQRDVDLMYKIYVGGFHVIDLDVDIGLNRTDYEFAAKVESVGIIGRMFPWWMKAYSRGEISDATVTPVIAGQRNNWRGKDRFIDLKFIDGVANIHRISPKPETDDRDRVLIDMRTGVMDSTSAIILLIRNMDAGHPCQAQMPVFDGRRRYDLIAKPDGVDRLRPSGYTPYAGETVNCRLAIAKKAGFKKTMIWLERRRSQRTRWMAKLFGDVPPVPVRLTINTPLGSVIAHLNAAAVELMGVRSSCRARKRLKINNLSGTALVLISLAAACRLWQGPANGRVGAATELDSVGI